MNDDQLIDHALKEHARHQGEPDQEFLDELETKLELAEEEAGARESGAPRRRKHLWSAMAALVMVAVTLGAWYRIEQKRTDEVAELSNPGSVTMAGESLREEAPQSPQVPTNVVGKITPQVGQDEGQGIGLLLAANTTQPEVTPTPFSAVPAPSKSMSFGSLERESSGFGDGNGAGGALLGRERQDGNQYGPLTEQGFLSPLTAPLSTFSVDVDTASYTNIRKLVESGRKVDPKAVRIEEMINYFDYQYSEPAEDHPFAVHAEVADCPWNAGHRLVKVALQGKEVKDERKAANLVFLIDVSGSMKSPDKLPLLVKSFELLLKSLREEDRVSLVVYAGRDAVLLNPTPIDGKGRTTVSGALQKLTAGGSTNGAAGISTAYDLARSGFIEGGVNRVILATDGDFNVGMTNRKDLVGLVKNQAEGNISLTILGFGQGNLNDHLMEELTNQGDGNYFYLDSLREGQRVFGQKLTGTIETIASDVKIQVEFNPGKVARYRLIGYANRRLKDEDFTNDRIDAGDIGAGHAVTALYEVIPNGGPKTAVTGELKYQETEEEVPPRKIIASPEMLTVKLRYKKPDEDISTGFSKALVDEGGSLDEAGDDFRFASSVALWGLLLSDSEYAGKGTIEMIEKLALAGVGEDPQGERAEFLDLLRKWQSN